MPTYCAQCVAPIVYKLVEYVLLYVCCLLLCRLVNTTMRVVLESWPSCTIHQGELHFLTFDQVLFFL